MGAYAAAVCLYFDDVTVTRATGAVKREVERYERFAASPKLPRGLLAGGWAIVLCMLERVGTTPATRWRL
jgi:hypothetical protein